MSLLWISQKWLTEDFITVSARTENVRLRLSYDKAVGLLKMLTEMHCKVQTMFLDNNRSVVVIKIND